MPWNDQIFLEAVEAAAAKIGKSRTAALKEAGISSQTFAHPPDFGRRTDIFERLMPVLGWSEEEATRIIVECLGWSVEIGGVPPALRASGKVTVLLDNVEIHIVSQGRAVAAPSASG